jgi:hypothetical protein
MKPLTLFLFLSLSLAGFGQDTTRFAILDSDTLGFIHQPIYDTVAVWIECADTTKLISYNMTVSGYEVTKTYWVPEYWDTRGFYLTYHEAYWQTDHVCYLDHFKKPLPFLGWGTKERK